MYIKIKLYINFFKFTLKEIQSINMVETNSTKFNTNLLDRDLSAIIWNNAPIKLATKSFKKEDLCFVVDLTRRKRQKFIMLVCIKNNSTYIIICEHYT